MSDELYKSLGASASKEGIHGAIERAGVSHETGFFAVLNDDMAGDPAYKSFVHCDGAGTKSLIAYVMACETNDVAWYGGLAQDALVMNLDDVYCVGAPQSLLLANTICRNARLISDVVIEEIIRSYRTLIDTLSAHGIPIQLSGGETADMGDVVRTLVVDAVVTGRIAAAQCINTRSIAAGDCIIGLESGGRATYEDKQNSGIGSNGLTLARNALMNRATYDAYPAIADSEGMSEHSYSGSYAVTDKPEVLAGMSVGEALLSPTRTFAPVLQKLFTTQHENIHGVIHVTGGGLTKVLRFGPGGLHFIKDKPLPVPPIFSLVQQVAGVAPKEMYQVFNMGQRIEIYAKTSAAEDIIACAKDFGIHAQVMGTVAAAPKSVGSGNRVTVTSPSGEALVYDGGL